MSTRFNAMLPFVLVAGCSDGATSETSTPAAVVDTGSAEDAVVVDTGSVVLDTASSSETSTGCAGKSTQPLDAVWKLDVDGRTRSFRVHVPASYDPKKPVPVVLNFHGYSSDALQQDLWSKMSAKADSAGFVAVHADGVLNSWNAGSCCGEAQRTGVDDVKLVGKMLDELESKLCVDVDRVFATGMSNGGFLSHRLACEMADRIAAIAPVAGVNGMETCAPKRKVPVLHFHGTLDTLVPYNGSTQFPAVQKTMDAWATRDGCSTTTREVFRNGDAHCSTYESCGPGIEVTLCTIDGGGHTWPGGTPVPSLGWTSTSISATDRMWSFFVDHPMPH